MQRRNRDIDYAFRQDSDLLYLCGFEEPDALLALIPGRSQGEVILFCRERDPRAEQWDGGICGPERAAQALPLTMHFPSPTSTKFCQDYWKAGGVFTKQWANTRPLIKSY